MVQHGELFVGETSKADFFDLTVGVDIKHCSFDRVLWLKKADLNFDTNIILRLVLRIRIRDPVLFDSRIRSRDPGWKISKSRIWNLDPRS